MGALFVRLQLPTPIPRSSAKCAGRANGCSLTVSCRSDMPTLVRAKIRRHFAPVRLRRELKMRVATANAVDRPFDGDIDHVIELVIAAGLDLPSHSQAQLFDQIEEYLD